MVMLPPMDIVGTCMDHPNPPPAEILGTGMHLDPKNKKYVENQAQMWS